VRQKANTGSQTYSVDHDIVTTNEYDSCGNCIRTTHYMSDPGTPNKMEMRLSPA